MKILGLLLFLAPLVAAYVGMCRDIGWKEGTSIILVAILSVASIFLGLWMMIHH